MKRRFDSSQICIDSNQMHFVSRYSRPIIKENLKNDSLSFREDRMTGSILYNVNIFTLKYIVDTSKTLSELRERLISYTMLASPYCKDIILTTD